MSTDTLVLNLFDGDHHYKATLRRVQEVEVYSSLKKGSDGYRHWVDANGNDYGPVAFSAIEGGWDVTSFDEISEADARAFERGV